MSIMLALLLQSAGVPTASPSPPPPQAEPAVAARIVRGMPVFDLRGVPVGNVSSINGDTVVIDTGVMKVAFAVSEFGMRSGALVSALTKAEVEMVGAQVETEVVASRVPLLKAGVKVVGSDGMPIGSIVSVEPGFVVVSLVSSGMVKLPQHSFAGSGGNLVMATTLERLRKLIASS